MRKYLVTLFALGLGFSLVLGQHEGPGGSMDPAIEFEVPEEIQVLRTEMETLRATLRESRQTLLQQMEQEGATYEEKVQALAQWREDNSEQIAEMQQLANQLREMIRELRPDPLEIPADVQQVREQVRVLRQELAQSRRQAILDLEDPTDEEIRAAIEAWREQNQVKIQQVQELAAQIRNWFREHRPDRPPPDVTGEMTQRRAQFRNNIQEMRQLRHQLMDPELTPEEHDALREQQRLLLQERRVLMRTKRNQEGGVGGDRRPGT